MPLRLGEVENHSLRVQVLTPTRWGTVCGTVPYVIFP